MSNRIKNEPVKVINPHKMQLAEDALLLNPDAAEWEEPRCPNRIFDSAGKRGVRLCCARCSCVLRQSNLSGAGELRCPDCHSHQFYVWQLQPKKNAPKPQHPVPGNAENSTSDTPSTYRARDSVRLLVSLFIFTLIFEMIVFNECKPILWYEPFTATLVKSINLGVTFSWFSVVQLVLFFAGGFLKDKATSRIGWRVLLQIPGVFIMTFAGLFAATVIAEKGTDLLIIALIMEAIGWGMVYFSLRRGKRNENT